MKKIFTYSLLAAAVAFTACKKPLKSDDGSPNAGTSKVAPDGFNFKTTKDVNLNLTLNTNSNAAIAGVVVNVYVPGSTSPVYKGVTNSNGKLEGTVTVPTSASSLIIDPAYVGLMRNAQAVISTSNTVNATIGGANGFSGDIKAQAITQSPAPSGTVLSALHGRVAAAASSGITFAYPSPYASTSDAVLNTSDYPLNLGRPAYLTATPDAISSNLLKYVNASLPEGYAVPDIHPFYLNSSARADINLTSTFDVWITYVSEGAVNKNTLAYYTYPTGHAPATVSAVTNATIVFPNTSNYGSGGGLKSGDKVKIGTFSAGTSIGFVLISNGWNGSGINLDNTKFFSDAALNPETTASLQKHTVTLYDDDDKLLLVGFEDLNRQTGSSDNDFNDVVFYATANPITALSTSGVPVVDKGKDTDGDGVIDALDKFPTDPARAYIYYFPSQTGYGSLAFEDNWPAKGDYDMNDLVLNYRFTFVANAQNKILDFTSDFVGLAAGAIYHNGFGMQLPVAPSAVQSVTGQVATNNYISFAANGVEAGQTKAVIIPFDNHSSLFTGSNSSGLINTVAGIGKATGKTISVKVTFTSPIDLPLLGFNPFLISNMRRGYEIHLPGYAPTDLANTKLFGTSDDTSAPASGKYYLSSVNMPWALNFFSPFAYPVEGKNINDTYLHFADWAASGGSSYPDWYSNTAAGYINLNNIFN